ncbi:Protein shisa-9-like protein [Dinothrombium tinctorium]|uniref:Protein shisa-9-like protein n=1 Tax=Dinothrombium tinctorium TaxID=1965070 RepID=A0A443QTY8_9ACAR|nr:Protein shisa-9-like protein [Dinothrombium tinctorium]
MDIPPLDEDHQGLGVQYCTGYVDKNSNWKPGFYCPPQNKKQNIYCCGTQMHKYCCAEKDGNNKHIVPPFVSSSTLILVIIITFMLAVCLTIFVFLLCKKYWKRGVEIRETHLYRMSSTSFAAPNGNNAEFQTLNPSNLIINPANAHYIPSHPFEAYHLPLNDLNRLALIEPPPPYQSTSLSSAINVGNASGGNNNSGRLFSVLTTPCRRDTVFPCDGRKRLWRTLSQ